MELLLPALCLHCGVPVVCARPGLCVDCQADLGPLTFGCLRCGLPRPLAVPSCARCRSWPESLVALAATRYAGAAESVVRALKYEGWRHLAQLCADRMAEALAERREAPDVLVPVPLHPVRLRSRGYNQAELIGGALAGRIDRPLAGLLSRTRATTPQVGLTRAARAANVAGAFGASGRADGAVVGLVDDVATSGATLAAAATVLAQAGAARVLGVTFALALDGRRG